MKIKKFLLAVETWFLLSETICGASQENQAYWHRVCMADNNRQAMQTRLVHFDYVGHNFEYIIEQRVLCRLM